MFVMRPLPLSCATSYGSCMQPTSRHQVGESLADSDNNNCDEGSAFPTPFDDDSDSHDDDDDDEGTSAYYKELNDSSCLLLRKQLLQSCHDFDVPVDPDRGHRASRIHWTSFQRPHMRAFHGAWILFATSWFLWFSMAPLMPILAVQLDLTKAQIWSSNLVALIGSIFLRFLLGPLCDQYGGRQIFILLLVITAIPCGLAGWLIQDYVSLLAVRAWIGCVGGTLVPLQFWLSSMFTSEQTGQVLGWASGWGASGGGIAQIVMGSVVYPLCLHYLCHENSDLAWRVALVGPALLALAVACYFWYNSDDYPLGSYKQCQMAGFLDRRSAVDSFRSGIVDANAWILFVQFGAALGVELVMDSGLSLHFEQRFSQLSTSQASACASLFGGMNLFARGLGGYCSDQLHSKFSLQGRLSLQIILFAAEGLLIVGFINAKTLPSALLWLVLFAIIGQMCIGSCLGIVPYINPRSTGTISGIAGAGGNLGGVLLSYVFLKQGAKGSSNDDGTCCDRGAFEVMAGFCLVAACLTPLIVVSGYRGLVWGREHSSASLSTAMEPLTLLTPLWKQP